MHDLGTLSGELVCEVVQLIALGEDDRGTCWGVRKWEISSVYKKCDRQMRHQGRYFK